MSDKRKIIAIDMLWLRPGRNGGTESYARNILDGLLEYSDDRFIYYLIASEQNKDSLSKYGRSPKFRVIVVPVNNESQIKRVIWSNLNAGRLVKKYGIDLWFSPVYSKPFRVGGIPCIASIMDIQAIHFPEYFSKGRNAYFRTSWKHTCRTADVVVTISEFCRRDIIEHFGISEDRIKVIYPVIEFNKDKLNETESNENELNQAESNQNELNRNKLNPNSRNYGEVSFEELKTKYGIKKKAYYYTVSSLAKHKNLFTLLRMMKNLRDNNFDEKLVITGVKESAENDILNYVRENGLNSSVIFTGYISDEERNLLYDNCSVFLYPSIFEGFGMPVAEAMERGIPVVTTKQPAIYEASQGKAFYVDEPTDEAGWEKLVLEAETAECRAVEFEEYRAKNIIGQYEKLFSEYI